MSDVALTAEGCLPFVSGAHATPVFSIADVKAWAEHQRSPT